MEQTLQEYPDDPSSSHAPGEARLASWWGQHRDGADLTSDGFLYKSVYLLLLAFILYNDT